MPTIDIDRDTAHEAAQRELAKPIYPRASLTDRIGEWLDDLINRVIQNGGSVPGGWLTNVVLAVLVALAFVVAVRIARRTMRTHRGGHGMFGAGELPAAQHRATAESYAAAGNWASAVRHRLRALARQLEESGLLSPVPGRTATELARDTGRLLPGFAADIHCAATLFNEVSYGGQPGTEMHYRMIAELDDALRRGAAPVGSDATTPPDSGVWVALR